MQKLKFIFGIHCHQPVGNFEHVFEETYQKAYLPFLETLQHHPRIKVLVHYSGVLYDWFVANHPEFIDLLHKLIKRRQIEVLSGGYYEPILSLIPDEDKIGQIEMESNFIKEKLGFAPQGMWLAERVWEPDLPMPLARAGIEYTLLDDGHLLSAGLSAKELFNFYITEEQGKTTKIFPINKNLRYLIPFEPPENAIEYLKGLAKGKDNVLVVFVCDGEKFGARPGTDNDYLEKLFSQLEDNLDWLQSDLPCNIIEDCSPAGRLYIPSASYPEMMEWSGGNFRNFLTKYPESNLMHKKMLHVSDRLETLRKGKSLFGTREKDHHIKDALRHLYMGQCNCAYWHGIYGGIYLNHLRHAVYSNLMKAEAEVERSARGSKPFVDLAIMDFDKDGNDEVVLSNNLLNLYFSPACGGSIFELDYKPKTFNLANNLASRKEAYHKKSKALKYDKHLRFSLLDHFLSPDTEFQEFSSNSYKEAGDFVSAPYAFLPQRKVNEVVLKLSRQGEVQGIPVKICKSVALYPKQSIVSLEYDVVNLGVAEDEFWFGVEFNFSMLAGNSSKRFYAVKGNSLKDKNMDSWGELEDVRVLKIVDEWSGFDVLLETDKLMGLWRFPVETYSRGEVGEGKHYQSSVVFPNWKFKLAPNQSWKTKITLRIEE